MDPILKNLLDAFEALSKEATDLLAKEKLDEEESKRLTELTADGGELDKAQKAFDDRKAAIERTTKANAVIKEPVLPKLVKIGGETEPEKKNDDPEKRILKFEEIAGSELVGIGPNGQRKSIDADGWGIDEKTWNAICEPGYKSAFNQYLRGKADHADLKAMQEGIDSAGGYLVPPDMAARITMRAPHPTSILANIGMMTTSRDRVLFPKHKYSTDDKYATGLRIAWTGENGPSAEDTSLQNWGMIDIPVHTGSFEVMAQRDFVEDTAFDIEGFVTQQAQSVYQLGLDNIVINGTGVGQPKGMLPDAGSADNMPTVNVGNPTTGAKLIEMVYGLPPQYDSNAKFLCNRTSVYATLAQIADSTGHFLFGLTSLDKGVLGSPRQAVLLGHEVIFSAFMPDASSANKIGIYADFAQAYLGVQRVGLSIEPIGPGDREMRRANQVGWYCRFRFGGKTNQDRAGRVAVQS